MPNIKKEKLPYFISLDVFDEDVTKGRLSPDAKLVLVYMYRCDDFAVLELDTHVVENQTSLDHERVLAAIKELHLLGLI